MKLTGIILAGGRNSRMGGVDKAFLVVDDKRIIERTVKLLSGIFDELLIVTNAPERYSISDVKLVPDLIAGVGPLGGIHAGLSACGNEAAFVCACDMPFLSAETISAQLAQYKRAKPDCLIARFGKWLEPLHSIYRRELIPIVEQTLRGGQRSIRDFIERCSNKSYFELTADRQKSLRNLNTPDDLKNE